MQFSWFAIVKSLSVHCEFDYDKLYKSHESQLTDVNVFEEITISLLLEAICGGAPEFLKLRAAPLHRKDVG